jgi:hypothetical protein
MGMGICHGYLLRGRLVEPAAAHEERCVEAPCRHHPTVVARLARRSPAGLGLLNSLD